MGIPVSANIGGGTFYYLFGFVSNDGDTTLKALNAVINNSTNYLHFEKSIGSQLLQWSDVTATFRVASHGDVRF